MIFLVDEAMAEVDTMIEAAVVALLVVEDVVDQQSNDTSPTRAPFNATIEKKIGHKEADCWSKQKTEEPKTNLIEQAETSETLFMAHFSGNATDEDVWFIDSWCSNHMSNSRSQFSDLPKSSKKKK